MNKRTEEAAAYLREHCVVMPNGCWHWDGPIHPEGYGRSPKRFGGSGWAHRAAHLAFKGTIRKGLTVDHTCHNDDSDCPGGLACLHRRCINPAHLEAVTQAENNRRADTGAFMRNKTHCPKGHAYAGANLYVEPSTGRRRCRICYAATQKAYKQRVRANRKANA